MAKGKFGQTLTAASSAAMSTSKNSSVQWVGILTAVVLAGGEAYLSRDANQDIQTKSAESEDSSIRAIEANARAITAGSKGMEALQADREKLEGSFRKAINALNAVARQHETRINALSISVQVEAKLRERKEAAAHHWEAVPTPPRAPSPEVEALQAPAESGKAGRAAVQRLKGYAQPRLVPRIWARKSR